MTGKDYPTADRLFEWLPPGIAGMVHELGQLTFGSPIVECVESQHIRTSQELVVRVLHRYFQNLSDRDALRLVQDVWREKQAFCLYLRGFHLGASRGRSRHRDPRRAITMVRAADHEVFFQRAIAGSIACRMPVVGIENPSDPIRETTFPQLRLANSQWKEVVGALISAARLIVVLEQRRTEGLLDELEMIAFRRKRDQTLLVHVVDRHPDSPDSQQLLSGFRQDGENVQPRTVAPARWAKVAQGFRYRLTIQNGTDLQRLLPDALERVLGAGGKQAFTVKPRVTIRRPRGKARDVREHGAWGLIEGYTAKASIGSFGIALKDLHVALMWGFLIDDANIRVRAMLEIGRVLAFGLRRPADALCYYKRALEIYEQLNVRSALIGALEECARVATAANDLDHAHQIRNRLQSLTSPQ